MCFQVPRDLSADCPWIHTDTWEAVSPVELSPDGSSTASIKDGSLTLDRATQLIDTGADDTSGLFRAIALALTQGRYDVAHMLLDDPNLDIKAAHHLLWRVADDARDGSVSSAEKLGMAKRLRALGAADQNPYVPIWQFCSRPLAHPSHHLELIAYLFHKAGGIGPFSIMRLDLGARMASCGCSCATGRPSTRIRVATPRSAAGGIP
ncbi:unnamed protein product [Vitrella brassicaformis CCMP3155]|uniref:Uncharacterized protein n=1 Tax=Vitrella brassicaformis (strain CCMP3155) TaxID=1169540 RepID=A0A0G4G4M1_VITBC|nr:unnamed protein product [Vitrella brassicaformis CCMP3155]|eukprot:CEM23356.1 unnamed protein product [Vitrella brassicaformis CCMP3155]